MLSPILFYLVACFEKTPQQTQSVIDSHCDPMSQWCEFSFKHNTLAIRFPQKITYLSPFKVKLKVNKELTLNSANIKFSMSNMNMGNKQFNFKPSDEKNLWIASVLLPICGTGRKDWLAEVKIKDYTSVVLKQYLLTIN